MAPATVPKTPFSSRPGFMIAAAVNVRALSESHIAADKSIFYRQDDTPEGLIREHPDGSRELVQLGTDGLLYVVRAASTGLPSEAD